MSNRVYRLLTRHQKLDDALRQELSRRWPDPLRTAQLKKMKLAIKDRLYSLSLGRKLRLG
jgi:uncharacterized protein